MLMKRYETDNNMFMKSSESSLVEFYTALKATFLLFSAAYSSTCCWTSILHCDNNALYWGNKLKVITSNNRFGRKGLNKAPTFLGISTQGKNPHFLQLS